MADEPIVQHGTRAQPPDRGNDQGVDDLLDSCIGTAEHLLSMIDKESEALKEFKTGLLLEVFPQKEALAKELSAKVIRLCALSGGLSVQDSSFQGDTVSSSSQLKAGHHYSTYDHEVRKQTKGRDFQSEKRSTLKQALIEIENHNRRNHVFIEGSLSYWQDLLNIFIPGTYAPAKQGLVRRQQPNTKGLALNKEI